MKPLLIGLSGLARVGKDTAAQHLVNHRGFQSYAFADPLRDGLMHILNLSPCDFEGAQKELWLLLAAQNLDLLARTHDTARGFVVSDIRFNNEADFIRKRGGVVVHMDRVAATPVNPHSSENGIRFALGDLRLTNDGPFDELFTNINHIVDTLHTRAAVA
jgi:hypothetical protein